MPHTTMTIKEQDTRSLPGPETSAQQHHSVHCCKKKKEEAAYHAWQQQRPGNKNRNRLQTAAAKTQPSSEARRLMACVQTLAKKLLKRHQQHGKQNLADSYQQHTTAHSWWTCCSCKTSTSADTGPMHCTMGVHAFVNATPQLTKCCRHSRSARALQTSSPKGGNTLCLEHSTHPAKAHSLLTPRVQSALGCVHNARVPQQAPPHTFPVKTAVKTTQSPTQYFSYRTTKEVQQQQQHNTPLTLTAPLPACRLGCRTAASTIDLMGSCGGRTAACMHPTPRVSALHKLKQPQIEYNCAQLAEPRKLLLHALNVPTPSALLLP